MGKFTGSKMMEMEFRQLKTGDLYWITDENEMREFARFTKGFTKRGELKVVNSYGMVNRFEDMRWPTKSEINECQGHAEPPPPAEPVKSYSKVEVKETEVSCKVSSTKKEEVKMGMLSKGSVLDKSVQMVKSDVVDASWRTGAREVIKSAKLPLTAFLAKQKVPSGALAVVGAVLDTQNGEAALALLLGASMSYVPRFANDAKFARLAKELRVLGMDNFVSQVASALLDPIRDALVEVVKQLPFGDE